MKIFASLFATLIVGCAADPSPPPQTPPATGERRAMSNAECTSGGGSIVGDIGDGSTHRADYVCANGKAPLGNIAPGEGEPIAIEGAVCCPK